MIVRIGWAVLVSRLIMVVPLVMMNQLGMLEKSMRARRRPERQHG